MNILKKQIMKGFLIGVLMIGITIGLYMFIISAKGHQRPFVPTEEVPVQLDNLDDPSADFYFNCDRNDPTGLMFNADDTLRGNVRITYVAGDTSYKFKTDHKELFRRINNSELGTKAKIKFTNIQLDYFVDSNLTDYAVNVFSLLKVIRERSPNDTYLDFIVVADGIVFQQEKYTGYIFGIAEDIVSTAMLMRDGYTMEGKNGGISVHELAHCLGLLHTHSPDESRFGRNCHTGDKIPTTVKVNPGSRFQYSELGECDWLPVNPVLYSEEERDIIVHNFMSYSHPNCLNSFELEQIDTMRKTIETNLEFRKIFNLERQSRYSSIYEEINY
jgi:hypothetical protein